MPVRPFRLPRRFVLVTVAAVGFLTTNPPVVVAQKLERARKAFGQRLQFPNGRSPLAEAIGRRPGILAPDLAIGGVKFHPQKPKTVRITLRNQGSKASEPCRLTCVVKKIGESNVARQKDFKVQSLAPNSNGILIIHLDGLLPQSVRAVETTFKLMVDSQKTISESNEKNNVFVHTGGSQPDLRVAGFLFPAAGPSTATEVKIANIGSASSAPCRLQLTIGEIEGTKVNRKKMVAVPKLNSMQAAVVTVNAVSILPGGVALSDTHFRLTVDATKHVNESNEQNNDAYHKP